MNISLVSEHASPLAELGSPDAGGQNVHVASLARALAARGHQVVVATRRDDPALPETVQLARGVVVRHLTAGPAEPVAKDALLPWIPELAEALRQDWGRRRPDVVHSHFWMSGLAACAASRSLPAGAVPVVHTYHALGAVKRREQGSADASPGIRIAAEAQLGREVDAIIATCQDEVRELAALGICTDKVSVVPCGVDLSIFTPDGPVEQRSASPRIAVVGRLVPRKGVDLVIRALGLLAERGRGDIELVVVGGAGHSADHGQRPGGSDDPEVSRLRALARAVGVEERVTFRGQLPQHRLPTFLRSVDAVVCAPWYEPFGIVPLEAMACGVPVIAARVGGLQDTVVDGVTGLLVPPREPSALADTIGQTLNDPARWASFGRAGRRRVEQLYSWSRVAQDTELVYREAQLGKARSRSARILREVTR